ncbi:hypothetical protein OAX78_03755 [Planctomycetota bacterium]|nr:hypothetical protein [Planctomycetota bacterium]
MEATQEIQIRTSLGRCPYCHDRVEVSDRSACMNCLAAHHRECWQDNGSCAACGGREALLPFDPADAVVGYEAACQQLGVSKPELEVFVFRELLSPVQQGSTCGFRKADLDKIAPNVWKLRRELEPRERTEPIGRLQALAIAIAMTAGLGLFKLVAERTGLEALTWFPLIILLATLVRGQRLAQ